MEYPSWKEFTQSQFLIRKFAGEDLLPDDRLGFKEDLNKPCNGFLVKRAICPSCQFIALSACVLFVFFYDSQISICLFCVMCGRVEE